jgi:translation initiation factor IF-3
MKRDCLLPGGLANLGDTIRVIDEARHHAGFMTVAEAQRLALKHGAELIVIARGAKPPVSRLVKAGESGTRK